MKSFFTLVFQLSLQLILLGFPIGLHAQTDPHIEWREIETEEAYWLFDARHHELAEYYIAQFQRAKAEVLPLFKEESRKMTIILTDPTDLANGSARVVPHPTIVLYTAHPHSYSAIGEFKHHAYELVGHEYTHILNMDPVHGWITPLYWIFGSIAHPNQMLPRWYTEGLAVYTESTTSPKGGRLNSQYLGGLARSLTQEKKWDQYPLSQLNDGHPDWLGGSRAYLFGGILWDQLLREDQDIIYKLNQSYSRRIPYLLDGALEYHLDKDYDDVLTAAYAHWSTRAQAQMDVVVSKPHDRGLPLSPVADRQDHSPKYSPDGMHLAFISSDLMGSGNIELMDRKPDGQFDFKKTRRVSHNSRSMQVAWHPASVGFVYEKLDRYRVFYRYYDLYYYDVKSKKSQRLTRGERAQHACFSAKGDTLYFLSQDSGHKSIRAMNWSDKKLSTLFTGAIGTDFQYLNCSKTGKLLFREQRDGSGTRLGQFDLNTKKVTYPLGDFPVQYIGGQGEELLIASSQSGIDNLYAWSEKQKPRAVTNSMTRALQGDWDPYNDSITYGDLTSHGPKLFSLEKTRWSQHNATPPQVPLLFDPPQRQPQQTQPTGPTTEDPQVATSNKHQSEEFSPWRYMYPNHWIPFLYVVDGGTLFQALTSAGDPLGINTISLVGQWDTLTKKPGASISYVNSSTPVSLGVALSDFYSFFYADGSNLHFSNATALASYAIPWLDNTRMLFRWNYSGLEIQQDYFTRQGPQLEFSYRQLQGTPLNVAPSGGWQMEIGHRNYLADLGNTRYGETYLHFGTYWSSFLPKRTSLFWGINGTYAPQLTNGLFATSTLAGPFFNPQLMNTNFLQRGYPTGIFLANNMINTNLEFHFPMYSFFKGWTGPPVFLRNLQGAIVFDASTLDGSFSDSTIGQRRGVEVGRFFTGYGLELETNMNVGFHVPIAFTLGLYYGQDEQAFGGFTTFFNVRL